MLKFDIKGVKELQDNLNQRSKSLTQEIKLAVTRLCIKLVARVKQGKLSGQVLNRRTGQLSRSVRHKIEDKGNGVVGVVGTALSYGKAHEFGFNGAQAVRQHARTITQAFGNPISPRQIIVGAHSRNMKLPQRSFLRSALNDMKTEVQQELNEAIDRALK